MEVVTQIKLSPALAALTETSRISWRPPKDVATLEAHVLPDDRLGEAPDPHAVPYYEDKEEQLSQSAPT